MDNEIHRLGPNVEPVTIPIEGDHVPRVKTLWKHRFGAPDDLINNWIADVLEEGKPTEGFVAVDGGNVLGFGIATIAGPDYVQEYIGHPDIDFTGWPKTGILHMLCVDKRHESRGIGSQLVEQRLRWLAAEGVDGVVGISWHRDEYRDSRPLFEKYGFEPVAAIENYYEESHGEPHCVDCDGGCQCDATIYACPLNQDTHRSRGDEQ